MSTKRSRPAPKDRPTQELGGAQYSKDITEARRSTAQVTIGLGRALCAVELDAPTLLPRVEGPIVDAVTVLISLEARLGEPDVRDDIADALLERREALR